ncbi:MAG: serine protease [Bdellovibrionaceae bacterium]|jgi:secreted trypsin-like serine protease|nr:serine protease [Pseudobdellovibrionaceae bacterium]
MTFGLTKKSDNLILGVFGLTAAIWASSCSPSFNSPSALELHEHQANPGIVGGKPVSSEDPVARSTVALYLVGTGYRVQTFCSGTLVTSRHVITAAHCIVNAAEDLGIQPREFINYVRVGFGNTVASHLQSTEVRFAAIKEYYIHPDFRPKMESFDFPDLAVLELQSAAPANYQPVPLASDRYLQKNQTITVAGFGLIRRGLFTEPTTRLQKTNLTIANPDFSSTHFTHRFNLTDGVCSGDSGGPVYVEVAPGQLALLGVISWSIRGCLFKGAYVSLPKFHGWLRSILGACLIEYRDNSMLRRLKELFC